MRYFVFRFVCAEIFPDFRYFCVSWFILCFAEMLFLLLQILVSCFFILLWITLLYCSLWKAEKTRTRSFSYELVMRLLKTNIGNGKRVTISYTIRSRISTSDNAILLYSFNGVIWIPGFIFIYLHFYKHITSYKTM